MALSCTLQAGDFAVGVAVAPSGNQNKASFTTSPLVPPQHKPLIHAQTKFSRYPIFSTPSSPPPPLRFEHRPRFSTLSTSASSALRHHPPFSHPAPTLSGSPLHRCYDVVDAGRSCSLLRASPADALSHLLLSRERNRRGLLPSWSC